MNSYHLLLAVTLLSSFLPMSIRAVEPVGFTVDPTVALQELNTKFCWFHPRAAAIPGIGKDGRPAVIMTIQKHLIADDHYSGLWMMRSDDLGKTWSGPHEIPELGWRTEAGNDKVHLAVADVTPIWHVKTQKLIAYGIQVRYDEKGVQLNDKPRSYDFAYSVFDPKTNRWTTWQNIDNVPEANGRFYSLAPGCAQAVIKPDGTLLVPLYTKAFEGNDYQTTVLHLNFDGQKLVYQTHGDEMKLEGGRGCYEPSLTFFRDQYYLTLRNDTKAYVTVSQDGLKYRPMQAWTFDDGSDLGSYNTQAHWLVHSDGLFLTYTRRGANNDHIARNRAPIFLAQVDPEKLQVIRQTEQVVLPERGVMLGNFGASNITPDESWITDSEFINNGMKHPKGADGTTWVGKIRWSKVNRLAENQKSNPFKIVALGDSITKAVRPGVEPTETYAWILGTELRSRGFRAETINVGIGGEQTDQALQRLDRDVVIHQPLYVTIMYGTNDSYQYQGENAPRLTRDQYRANLIQLVKNLRAKGAHPILMTPPRWGKMAKNGVGVDPNPQLANYLTACREVAHSETVPLVDHFQIWTDAEANGADIGSWTTDLCHPNPQGQRVIADALIKEITRHLEGTAR